MAVLSGVALRRLAVRAFMNLLLVDILREASMKHEEQKIALCIRLFVLKVPHPVLWLMR